MLDRRQFMISGTAAGLTFGQMANALQAEQLTFLSGDTVPAIGMGTWLTFNIGPNDPGFSQREAVLKRFFELGGGMIDSSPMYGQAEAAIGLMTKNSKPKTLFSATKIWTPFDKGGQIQLSDSHRLWDQPVLDLVYVHNLLNWRDHIKTLRAAKETSKVRNIGFTTSHGRRHQEMENLIKTEPVDAVQFTYNLLDRDVENRLLPAAADKGLTVVINRPFQGGRLFDRVANHTVPEWAEEWDIQSWAAFFLKYIISHPAVSFAIPATSQVEHMEENMRALQGSLPDETGRRRMAEHFQSII